MAAESPSLRDWIKQKADDLDVDKERLLFLSRQRDPMWMGTQGDHEQAEWFAEQYERAIQNREEDKIHCRGVHYSIIEDESTDVRSPTHRTSWDSYQNTEKCYGYLKNASVAARVLGYVPLDAIIDEKSDVAVLHNYGDHEFPQPGEIEEYDESMPTGIISPDIPEVKERARTTFDDDPGEALADALASKLRKYLIINSARQHPFHIEIWSEKTIPGTPPHEEGGPTGIYRLAREFGVNVIVEGQGDLSYSVARSLMRRINQADKPAVILYLSDFDPKGDGMATAMSGKLEWLKQSGHLDGHVVVKQLAVTEELIDRFDLPRTPIDANDGATGTGAKAYNTLVNEWEERKGRGAVELQALWRDSERFEEVFREAVDPLNDDDIGNKTKEAIDEWTDEVEEVAQEAVEDSDLPDEVDDLDEWVEEFNEAMEEAQEELEQLHEMKADDRYQDWLSLASEVMRNVEAPEIDPPTGEAPLPDGPLYDSDRSYFQNVAEARAHERGER